jgi:DinB superfamily
MAHTPLLSAERLDLTRQIAELPAQLEELVGDLTTEQLVARPLAGEWSVAQNVHHLADSHMNSFIRLKLILTEENPPLKPYDQDAWAERADANHPDIALSLQLLRGLHARWAQLFDSLSDAEWARTGVHPESGIVTPADLLRSYVRHGAGHLDQIARTLAAQTAG